MSDSPTMTLEEVATLLRYKPETFRKKRRALIAAGMPRPVVGDNGPVWSRRRILAWIDGVSAPEPLEEPLDPVTEARARLEARIARRAA